MCHMGTLHVPKAFCALVHALTVLLLVNGGPLAAHETRSIKRQVLAVYDGQTYPDIRSTPMHRAAEMPLNHLGYVLHYHDVHGELPSVDLVSKTYAAVIMWFTANVQEPRAFLRWAAAISRSGVRLIILGDVPGSSGDRNVSLISEIFAQIGLSYFGDYIRTQDGNETIVHDRESYSFEAELGPNIPGLSAIRVSDRARMRALVEVESGFAHQRRRSVAVAAGSKGGYVASQFEMRYEAHSDRLSWLINPFYFFSQALGPDLKPIPDVTTVAGRRLYFSHIDGDGWNNGAQMSPYREAGMLASEVMVDELIDPYPDLPVTMGLIAGDVLAEHGGSPETERIARRIFELPQVEVGSHTCTHPFVWGFFKNYSRARELELLKGARSENEGYVSRLARLMRLRSADTGDIAGSADLPRAYLRHPFDLGVEVDRAIEMTERLAPPGKKLKVYQWSGDTSPFEAAIARTRKLGLRNINGGDTRFDADYPSVIYVAPVGLEVGRERQVYAVNSNENTYTNDWSGPYYAFRNLKETLRRTDMPRRLKGFNVYYHTYSAERQASLDAVKAMLELARRSQITPITTSHYAAIADGFFGTSVRSVGNGEWLLENRGALNTVRFDDADAIGVDFDRSEGVLGETRHAGSLYVALDPVATVPKVAIGSRSREEDQGSRTRPVLVDARWPVEQLLWESTCHFSFEAQGFGKGDMTWLAEPNVLFRISAHGEATHWELTASSDASGQLRISLPPTEVKLSIDLACMGGERAEALSDAH